jgi:PPOX class probable F420-dependent enzyme
VILSDAADSALIGAVRPAFSSSWSNVPASLSGVSIERIENLRTLLEAPSPAVLTTYRKDASAAVSPVWFRFHDGAFEVVIATGDVKLRHLARDPRCALLVFETVPPFRGIEVRGIAALAACDTSVRAAIAGRYLGAEEGVRFAAERRNTSGWLLRLGSDDAKVWDLSGILPA